MVLVRLTAALGIALALGACSSAAQPGASEVIEQSDKAAVVQIESDLRSAATAQESYFTENASYAADVAALEGAGLNVSNDTVLTVAQASATDYCVEATSARAEGTWHISRAEMSPQEGPC